MIGKASFWCGAVSILLMGLLTQSLTAGEMPKVSGQLKEVQAAMERYKDPINAIRDGYLSTVGCVMMPKGAMGIHFVNGSLIGPTVDPMKPQVLLYEPVGEKLELVSVEWLVPYIPGKSKRPSLFGKKFHGPMEGHEPLLPKQFHHYDLHIWLFKKNPNGLFADTNPNVKCSGKTIYTIYGQPSKIIKQ